MLVFLLMSVTEPLCREWVFDLDGLLLPNGLRVEGHAVNDSLGLWALLLFHTPSLFPHLTVKILPR